MRTFIRMCGLGVGDWVGEEKALIIKGGSVGRLGLWRRVTGDLAAMIYSLKVVAMIHYLWLVFGRSVFAATTQLNPGGNSKI